MSGRTRITLAAVAAALSLAVAVTPASAATLNVCHSGCTYSTIQDAINAANNGDTIKIAAGTYIEDLNTDSKNLSLTGAGATKTTIDANGTGRVVQIDSGSVKLSGVTITGGFLSGFGAGGGILNNGTLILNDSTVTANTAPFGGGIYSTGTLTLNHTTVTGNTALEAGGILSTDTATLNQSAVTANTATRGGGIENSVGTLTLNKSTVSGNTASDQGGGIENLGTATLNNSTVSGNTATNGNGGGIVNTHLLTLNNSKVTGNTAGGDGGGIWSNSVGTVTLSNSSTVQCNTPDDISPPGSYTQKGSKVGPPGPC